jgi:hypothetical protein
MRTAMLVLIALALITIVPAIANAQTYYIDIYNTAPSSIESFAVAPAGTQAFRDIALADRTVHGGGDSVTVAFDKADGGCLRNFRTRFVDGRVLIQNGFNMCKFRSYHTGRYWRATQHNMTVAAQP